jgi:hypothetical protein
LGGDGAVFGLFHAEGGAEFAGVGGVQLLDGVAEALLPLLTLAGEEWEVVLHFDHEGIVVGCGGRRTDNGKSRFPAGMTNKKKNKLGE